jgi:hypothetical protein
LVTAFVYACSYLLPPIIGVNDSVVGSDKSRQFAQFSQCYAEPTFVLLIRRFAYHCANTKPADDTEGDDEYGDG